MPHLNFGSSNSHVVCFMIHCSSYAKMGPFYDHSDIILLWNVKSSKFISSSYYHATLKLNNHHELRKLITLNDNAIEIFSKVNKKFFLNFFFSSWWWLLDIHAAQYEQWTSFHFLFWITHPNRYQLGALSKRDSEFFLVSWCCLLLLPNIIFYNSLRYIRAPVHILFITYIKKCH